MKLVTQKQIRWLQSLVRRMRGEAKRVRKLRDGYANAYATAPLCISTRKERRSTARYGIPHDDLGTTEVVSTDVTRGRRQSPCTGGCYDPPKAALPQGGGRKSLSLGESGRKSGDEMKILHGRSRTVEYRVWGAMLHRCRNPANANYAHYGGRGITVCERWHKFENFFADMGERPSESHTIERRDNNLGYSKYNCKWATQAEQNDNRSNSRKITAAGITDSLAGWARRSGFTSVLIHARLRRGWSPERAVFDPIDITKRWTSRRGNGLPASCENDK